MVKRIDIKEVKTFKDKEILGSWPKESDVDQIFREDVDVYLPNGDLAISFRKGILKSTLPVSKGGTLTQDNLKYWQWASKALSSDQRGNAAGRDIHTNPEIRLTLGQVEFFKGAIKGTIQTSEDARKVLDAEGAHDPSRTTYFIGKAEADGYVDLEEVEKHDKIVRCRSKYTVEEVNEARKLRNIAKLAWFERWLEAEWVPAEDKVSVAKAAKKRYVTSQPRANRCFSNVLGAIDRSGRIPYGRLTKSTESKRKQFEDNQPFYHEINDLLRKFQPDKFEILNSRFKDVHPDYNLFGTAFTTITVNNNFQVAYHRDGNNAENAVAALAVMEIGEWDGGEFVFPELGIGFDIREGDVFIGDNQGLIHGMLPINEKTTDAENIMFVFYQRDGIVRLDSPQCEECRKEFLAHSAIHYKDKGTGEPKWAGSFAGMWTSDEWREFKAARNLADCKETNYWGT
jgi:hypothetical protein